MRIIIFAIIFFFTNSVFSQTDTIYHLTNKDWKTSDSWFGDKKVVLNSIEKLVLPDTARLERDDKDSVFYNWKIGQQEYWGERIFFNNSGVANYRYYISCPVGETLYRVNEFNIKDRIITIEYAKFNWEDEPNLKKTKYKLTKITSDQIELTKM